MTLDRCVELLRELRSLERIALAIASRGLDADWDLVLELIQNRVYWMRGALRVEDADLLRAASAVLRDEALSTSTSIASARHLSPALSRTIH